MTANAGKGHEQFCPSPRIYRERLVGLRGQREQQERKRNPHSHLYVTVYRTAVLEFPTVLWYWDLRSNRPEDGLPATVGIGLAEPKRERGDLRYFTAIVTPVCVDTV